MAALPQGEPRVIVATGSCIGEGFDDANLDTLFLAWPISWKGTLQQYVGRLHRMLHANKKVVRVYDYVDNQVPTLARMFAKRVRGYKSLGYIIEEPVKTPAPKGT
jgi:superfamily II DNA or RNA helicase